VLYQRDIRDRVDKLAPFLDFDADPYPVVVDGRIVWVLDAYTTTDRYPYSQSHSGQGGLDHEFNYVRNSVKATVDAYDGTVTFYVVDEEDPLIRAYRKAFPDLFTDFEEMPDALRDHLRYPEDLFRLGRDGSATPTSPSPTTRPRATRPASPRTPPRRAGGWTPTTSTSRCQGRPSRAS